MKSYQFETEEWIDCNKDEIWPEIWAALPTFRDGYDNYILSKDERYLVKFGCYQRIHVIEIEEDDNGSLCIKKIMKCSKIKYPESFNIQCALLVENNKIMKELIYGYLKGCYVMMKLPIIPAEMVHLIHNMMGQGGFIHLFARGVVNRNQRRR